MGIADELFSSKSTNVTITSSAAPLSPSVGTPPRSRSPMAAAEKRKSDRASNMENVARRSSIASNGIDADQLQKVLRDFDNAGKARDITPAGSPARKRQRVYGDR